MILLRIVIMLCNLDDDILSICLPAFVLASVCYTFRVLIVGLVEYSIKPLYYH